MDNKKLGLALIIVALLLGGLLYYVKLNIDKSYQKEIDSYVDAGLACPSDPGVCPHELRSSAQVPIYIAWAVLFGVFSLGVYLVYFDRGQKVIEKSQKAIMSTLEKQRVEQTSEQKFEILLKGLNPEERKVIMAVKDQSGITQQTLRLRTDMHKSKLSIVLDGLEKKELIKRIPKGKTKQVYLRVAL